jgi:hypothetical protein
MTLRNKNTPVKFLLGFGSFLPFLASVAVLALMTAAFNSADPVRVARFIGPVVGSLVLSLILGFGLAALFAIDAYRDPRLTSDARALWLVFMIAIPPIAVPAYWITRIRSSK